MSNNFNILKASGSQKFLIYDIKKPSHEVKAYRVTNNNSIFTSLSEYSKIGFNYPSYKLVDPSNQFDKDKIFQSDQTLEFNLDIEPNCLVPQLFFLMQFQNKNSGIDKSITHISPIVSIENITLQLNSNTRYTIKPEDIYIYNCVRLSHGDKMFPDLIDNLGISSTYDVDPVTNEILPASKSK